MKKIVISLIVLIGLISVASANTKIQKGDISLSQLTTGKILSVETVYPNCPINAFCGPSTKVRLELTLNGCADRIGPVTYTSGLNEFTQKIDISVSAINIHNELSTRSMCKVFPTVVKEFFLGPWIEKDSINLNFLR